MSELGILLDGGSLIANGTQPSYRLAQQMSSELIARAWKRIIFTSEIPRASVQAFVSNSQKAGFMRTPPDLSRLFETP